MLLRELYAVYLKHRRCGELDGGIVVRVLTPPTRDFVLVVDPYTLNDVLALNNGGLVRLALELKRLPMPVNINLVLPAYLLEPEVAETVRAARAALDLVRDESIVPPLMLSREIGRRHRERIERGAEGECRGLRLLALAEYLKADGIVTTIPSLVEARYPLRRHHAFRILSPTELLDFVEVCSRGHSVFCTARPAPMYLPPDVFYQFADPKARRLFEWYNKAGHTFGDEIVREHLRSAMLNRYSFILYARDMTKFYEIQKQYYSRRQGRGRPAIFRALVNYHLTTFYVHIWGMLDTLAGIANRRFSLGLHPRQCYLVRDEFLDALERSSRGLARFIKEHRGKWVDVIGDVRHPVAHSALLLQQNVVVHTEESKKSDAEIAAIIRAEEREFLASIPPALVPSFEATLISNWRFAKMKVETDDAIYVENPTGGGYFRGPVVSVDFDLEMLNAFVDAFLVACFSKRGLSGHGGGDMNARNTVITPATGSANISPIGFHRYASEFAASARLAQPDPEGRFSPVPYYLYCRSLELVLKAFLLAKGVAKDDLKGRNLGHDLLKNLLKARELGLDQTITFAALWEDEIGKANVYYASKGFEYFDVISAARGYPQLPALDALNEIVTALLERLKPICLAA